MPCMRADLPSPGPLLVAHLLAPLDKQLVDLLASLPDADWEAPTIVPGWRVRDIAAHLIDTALRTLVICRDGHLLRVAGHDPARDLVGFVNRLNADGVRFFSALAPRHLVGLLGSVSRASARFHESLDPMAPAMFGVSWAGEATSLNWFGTARELTERWHHQQQIRLAVQRPGAVNAEFAHPVLDCFMRALPHWYRSTDAAADSLVEITVDGEGGGTWHLFRDAGAWRLITTPAGTPRAQATIPVDIAWRVFTKGIGRAEAESRVRIVGDYPLAAHLLKMITIVG